MSPALRELLQESALDEDAIRRFLEARSIPIVEGRNVTFVYRGRADAVYLQHWIFGLPSSQPFQPVDGTDLWYLTLDIPPRSRVEYKLEVQVGEVSRLIRDPLNPQLAHDPFGANSVCHGAGYEEPDWVFPDPKARRGTIEEIRVPSRALDREEELWIYLPARFRRRRRYPLLVVHDGRDYMRFAALQTVLDNLIHRNEVAPVIAVLHQSQNRLREYADDERHATFLTSELIPELERKFPLLPGPAERGLVGASFGAVASFSTCLRRPGYFGRLLLQSGSFAFTDIGPSRRGPLFDPIVKMVNQFREEPRPVAQRAFISCGVYESLIYENRSLVPVLQSTEMELKYVEAHDGHNWENWRDRLRDGLTYLFPGPLWMIYE